MEKQVDYESLYREADVAVGYGAMNRLKKELLKDSSQVGLERHYNYFIQTNNSDLKRILGNGLLQRDDVSERFWCKKLEQETDEVKITDILFLLRMTYDSEYTSVIAPSSYSGKYDIRHKATIVLGWIGDSATIKQLINHYGKEQDALRKYLIISAMRGIFFRLPAVGDDVLTFLHSVVKEETCRDIIGISEVTIQLITCLKSRVAYDEDTGELSDDVMEVIKKVVNSFY